ncbi:immunoglobulin domain-containing protein [Geothrix sp.]|uniref:immunoglobulin domain-containing protein n=1 Tax=Geothrix sp. TaxID=1962974 RepID=UPI0026034EFC|nr:immunoglobulin domain-containing protein [Geothrix sp.]WIL20291.1 MAG: immunoglobulin domain-containing protein [Geothrix sp.]
MFQTRFLGRWVACFFLAGTLVLGPACGGGGGSNPAPTPAATVPVISTQPASQAITEGGSAAFSIGATGNGTLTYQWKKGGADLAGKTSATLTLNPVALTDAGSYTVLVTNTLNGTSQATLSSVATLTVNPAATAPVIGTQPASQAITEGGSAAFSIGATGNGTLTYQWKKGGADLAGKTSATLTLNPVALTDAGSYTVLVTNTLNGTSQATLSSVATLTVNPAATAPVIGTQPASQSVTEGGSAAFSIGATGNGTLTYQWKKGGADLAGKTSATLTLNPVALTDAGSYTVLVTNTLNGTSQSILSSTAMLTVTAPAATHFSVAGFTNPTAAGTSHTFTVTALDASNNPVPGYAGTVHFTSSDAAATLPGDYTFAGADSGTHTFSATLKTAGSQSLTATDTVSGSITGTQAVTVNAVATHFGVTGFTNPTTAGTSHTFTITALDASNNPVPGYAGTVHFTSSDAAATLPGDYTFAGADSGTHTFSATLKSAGSQSLTATDTVSGSITGTQAVTVNAVATHFGVTGFTSPTTSGASHTFTVTALDAYGNTATGYAGTIHITSTDPVAILPGDYAFAGSDNGAHSFMATLNTAGAQTLTATDTVSATLTGSQAAITVSAQAPVIQTQPQGANVIAPEGATFTVAATGIGTLTYQWRKNGTDIPGEMGTSLTVGPTDLQEISATYSVVVKDGSGATTTSENATLTVMAPEPTYAGDPVAVPSRPLTVLPSYQVGTAFPHGAFRVGYDETLKNPAWTTYANFKFTTAFANGTRTFLADDRLAAPQVTDGDYSGSGWTRGHQVMMSDLAYRYGSQAGTDSCRLSNVAPQDTDHNNNFWNHLEQVVGGSFTGSGGAWAPGLADTFNRIWIYTGPTFDAGAPLLPGAVAPVRISSGFWKVVVRETAPGQPKVVAVLTPNKAGLAMSEAEIQKYTTSVARIEALTGLDLFPAPASPLPATFKTAVDVRGWGSAFEVMGKPNVHMVAPSWDISSPVGTVLTFQGDATSPNNSVASTSWAFGDGQTANGPTASHSYTAGGTYSVTFTATDGLGVSNAVTRVVTVTGGNQAPTVTGLPASDTTPADTAKDLAFTVSDDVAPLAVTFTASSSDQSIVPDSGLSFTGTMASPVLHIVPATGATGTVTLTVRVTDGDLATTTKTLTFAVGIATPPTALSEAFTWAGTGTVYATGDYTLSTGSWHFVTTMSYAADASDAKNDGQGLRMKAAANSAVWMNFDFGSASTQASSVSVAYGVYKSDGTAGKTASFSLYYSQDQGGTWTKVGSSVTASSNTLSTATFSGLNLTGPVRFKLAVDGTPAARLNLDDFRIQ